ncbi:MAG TPA: phosphoribosyltransferase domain-containing protein [Allosphingosinicella sp.]|nr:phosphoribosyltransferase domain-containing protein [Allosphingosinicella sp.]
MTAVSPEWPRRVEVDLGTGRLSLDIARSAWPLDRLCGFALRRNPKRAFLIVSRLLGRHIPARPSEMRAAARALAAALPVDLPGTVLTVGLAETAVCLGQTVHEEQARLRGTECHYLHSTRQEIEAPLLCRFEEPHSHASAHLIYRPRKLDLAGVGTLLLVDDEISTGTTLVNLAAAIASHLPSLERIAVAALTDWSGGKDWLKAMPRPARAASLLEGRLEWHPAAQAGADREPDFAVAPGSLGRIGRHWNSGRLGVAAGEAMALPDYRPPGARRRLRIVGTGEFTYPPFLLAERLESEGHDVVVQATSRSPIVPGGAIGAVLRFADNYGTNVPNFLYNADPSDGRHSIICHETPPGSVDPALVEALGAETLFFEGPSCAP